MMNLKMADSRHHGETDFPRLGRGVANNVGERVLQLEGA